MSDEAGRVSLGMYLDNKSIQRQAAGMQRPLENMFGGMGKKLGAVFMAGFSVKALVDFGKKCLDLGSDLAEVQNVVDVTFTSMNGAINEFAQNAAMQFGLSETMAKRYAGTFGSMAKAFGFAEQDVADMSMALTGLAGDVASFYNIDQDEAFSKLKAIFTGETEGLKSLGIVMTQTALDQFALQNGFGKTTAAMSDQEKVALRYQFVLSKLSDVSGDFARTSDGWANQVRILKLQFESLCSVIGSVLIEALTPSIKALNSFMGALIKAANTFKSFVFSLLGKESEDMAAGTAAAISGVGEAAADSFGGMGDAATGAAKDTQKASNAIRRALMGFDQINKLSGNSGSGGSGGGAGSSGGGIGAGSLGDISSALKNTAYEVTGDDGPLAQVFQKIIDSFKTADFTEIGGIIGGKLRDALNKIPWGGIKDGAKKIVSSFTTLLNGFFETEGLADSVGSAIGEAINTGVSAIGDFFGTVSWDSIGAFFSEGFQEAFRKIEWGDVTGALSNILIAKFDFVSGFLEGIEWDKLQDDLGDALIEAFEGVEWDRVGAALWRLTKDALIAAITLSPLNINKLFDDFTDVKAEILGLLDWIGDIEFKFDPFGEGVSLKLPEDSLEVYVTARANELKDDVPPSQRYVVSRADLTSAKDCTNGSAAVNGATANVARARDQTDGKAAVNNATVNYTKPKDQTKGKATVNNATVNLTKPKDQTKGAAIVKNATASMTRALDNVKFATVKGVTARFDKDPIDALTDKQKTISVKAQFTGTSGVTASKKAAGGVFSGGSWHGLPQFAAGGTIASGIARAWDGAIPKYAGGTANAHGTLFEAGENGPEIVGHIGGRTEVLNKSQIASAIYAAVKAAISDAFSRRWAPSIDRYTPRLAEIGSGVRQDTASLVRIAQQAAAASSGGGNAEVLSLLRQILHALQTLDLDVELDGQSIKRRIVALINADTNRTGVCEIVT